MPSPAVIPAEAVDEGFLAALGVHRLELPLAFIEAGGPANVYAIENDDSTWTFFDTGIGTQDAISALYAQASERGIDLKRISRIIISHGHLDHFGNAQLLAEESGAPVFIHPADLEKVCGEQRFAARLEKHRSYYMKLGVPGDVLQALIELARDANQVARPIERGRVQLLGGCERLHFKRFDANVLHMPGHTPGLVCLHAPAQKLLFADDHVLARVSPNPLLDLSQGEGETKFLALVRYLEGARAVQAMELDCVLPGHGGAFRNHRELLAGLFELYGKRQEKMLNHVRTAPASAFALVAVVFPRHPLKRLHLLLSEIVGNLEVLELEGRVRRELDANGHFVFHAAEPSLP